ncbi:MAG: DUF1924 domain-containing protein [Nitrospinota bacterium]
MGKKYVRTFFVMGVFSISMSAMVSASTLETFIQTLKEEAKIENPDFQDFSVKRGEELFYRESSHPEDPFSRACFTCHTKDLKKSGTHYVSGKVIEPLSPEVNPKRLSDVKKLKKWFKRNCSWVLQRACSPLEKGDFLAYLQSN